MYRLICQKLQGCSCTWCEGPFDESSSAGLYDGADTLVLPATVPKVFVLQCGHAIHTTCFGSQLVPDRQSGPRGHCRRCGLPYAWSSIDVDPLTNAFCLLFGPYVDKRVTEMRLAGEISDSAVLGIAEVCQSFSQELGGLLSPSSVWVLLARRHDFADPEAVMQVGDAVLRLFAPREPADDEECREPQQPLLLKSAATIICPEDRDDEDDQSCHSMESPSAADRDTRHLTEVFLPAPGPEVHTSPEQDPEFMPGGAEEDARSTSSEADAPGAGLCLPEMVLP